MFYRRMMSYIHIKAVQHVGYGFPFVEVIRNNW